MESYTVNPNDTIGDRMNSGDASIFEDNEAVTCVVWPMQNRQGMIVRIVGGIVKVRFGYSDYWCFASALRKVE
jgi:hypothetical protein